MPRTVASTDRAPAPVGAYSQAVIVEPFVFVAGQGPADPATRTIPTGIEAQTNAVMRNVDAILRAAGSSLDEVVKVNVHLADVAEFAAFDAAYASHFAAPYPARTTVGSQLSGIRVEIDVVARRVAA